jgi:hypothetical protein
MGSNKKASKQEGSQRVIEHHGKMQHPSANSDGRFYFGDDAILV